MATAAEIVLLIFAIIMFIVLVAIWSLQFISLIYGKYKFHKKSKRGTEREKLPGVSIIKPLMGVDENLMQNLETFFTLDYPIFEILFCVQDNTDPVISVVKHLLDKYPNVDAKLFSGGKSVGINPKINNMMQGYDAAKYELMLISDAGIKMASDTLTDMASLMTERVGLVHQMPFVCDRPGFAGTLEKVYFGTCHCRMYLFINLIGVNCVTGMSCLMRKDVLDKIGGLQKFGNYIAEDYFLAQAYLDNNWVIQLSHQPAMQNSASYSTPTWQKRMIRWCKLRLKLNVMSWLEPIQECFMLGLCTCWTVNYLFGWNSLVFFLIHVLGWFLCDYMLLKLTQNGKLPFTKFDYVVAWLYRETICYYLFLKAGTNPIVKWRDGKYRLRWGGLAEEIVEADKSTSSSTSTSSSSSSSATTSKKTSSNLAGSVELVQSTVTNKYSSNTNLSNAAPGLTTVLSPNAVKNLHLNHKRTNSYTVMMNSSSKSNQSLFNSNSDIESSPSQPLLGNYGGNSQLPNSSPNKTAQSNGSPKPYNQRAHHQHHHSISSPISFQPTLISSSSALIDESKFTDLKIV